MRNEFSWKGMKIGLIGLLPIGISLFVTTKDKQTDMFLNILMLAGIIIIWYGMFLHYREMSQARKRNG